MCTPLSLCLFEYFAQTKSASQTKKKRHWPRRQQKNDSSKRQKYALVLLRALAPSSAPEPPEAPPSSAPRRTKPLAKEDEEIPSVGFKILTPEEREPSGARNGTCRHLLKEGQTTLRRRDCGWTVCADVAFGLHQAHQSRGKENCDNRKDDAEMSEGKNHLLKVNKPHSHSWFWNSKFALPWNCWKQIDFFLSLCTSYFILLGKGWGICKVYKMFI